MCNKADFINLRKGVADSLYIQNGDRLKSLLQRTGIFARMQELGMVERVKEGRSIHYLLME